MLRTGMRLAIVLLGLAILAGLVWVATKGRGRSNATQEVEVEGDGDIVQSRFVALASIKRGNWDGPIPSNVSDFSDWPASAPPRAYVAAQLQRGDAKTQRMYLAAFQKAMDEGASESELWRTYLTFLDLSSSSETISWLTKAITDSERRQNIAPKAAELLAELLSGMGAWGLEANATNAVSPAQAREYLLEILEGEAESRQHDLKYYSKSDHGSDAELIGPVVRRAMSEVDSAEAREEIEALGELLRGHPNYKEIVDGHELLRKKAQKQPNKPEILTTSALEDCIRKNLEIKAEGGADARRCLWALWSRSPESARSLAAESGQNNDLHPEVLDLVRSLARFKSSTEMREWASQRGLVLAKGESPSFTAALTGVSSYDIDPDEHVDRHASLAYELAAQVGAPLAALDFEELWLQDADYARLRNLATINQLAEKIQPGTGTKLLKQYAGQKNKFTMEEQESPWTMLVAHDDDRSYVVPMYLDRYMNVTATVSFLNGLLEHKGAKERLLYLFDGDVVVGPESALADAVTDELLIVDAHPNVQRLMDLELAELSEEIGIDLRN